MALRILYIAEIISKPGLYCFKAKLPELKEKYKPDLVILNADSCTGGFGLGKNHAMQLRKIGADVITGGDQIYYKKDLVAGFDQMYHVLRPANYPSGNPGRGWKIQTLGGDKSKKVALISMMGQAGFSRIHLNNPFTYLPELVKRLKAETPWIIMDFHSVTTAEKQAMSFHADGLVSVVFGSGMRVMTADCEIMPGGTGVISDCGKTGSQFGVNGFDPQNEIEQFLNGVPQRSSDYWEGLEIQYCVADLDDSGKTTYMEAFRLPVERSQTPEAAEAGDESSEDEGSAAD